MDYYRVLNVSRSATVKEIKHAYLKLAKTLHPDVTGNDEKKAELFKHVSEAHTVLSDATKRRQYDASRPMQGFGQQPTGARAWHPYASSGDSRTASSFRQGMGGRLYGLDEEVWLAHHYGPNAAKYGRVHRNYGMNIVEDRIEKEEERITKMTKHYKLRSTAAYFLRRDARIKQQAEDEAARRKKEGKRDDDDDNDDGSPTGCTIS